MFYICRYCVFTLWGRYAWKKGPTQLHLATFWVLMKNTIIDRFVKKILTPVCQLQHCIQLHTTVHDYLSGFYGNITGNKVDRFWIFFHVTLELCLLPWKSGVARAFFHAYYIRTSSKNIFRERNWMFSIYIGERQLHYQ